MSQEILQIYGVGKYENVVCTDNDLLFISNTVSRSCTEVCETLKLSVNVVQEIEEMDVDDYKKIYLAFIAWCEKRENATWGELAKTICNDGVILQTVTKFLAEYPPRIEGMCPYNLSIQIHFIFVCR